VERFFCWCVTGGHTVGGWVGMCGGGWDESGRADLNRRLHGPEVCGLWFGV